MAGQGPRKQIQFGLYPRSRPGTLRAVVAVRGCPWGPQMPPACYDKVKLWRHNEKKEIAAEGGGIGGGATSKDRQSSRRESDTAPSGLAKP